MMNITARELVEDILAPLKPEYIEIVIDGEELPLDSRYPTLMEVFGDFLVEHYQENKPKEYLIYPQTRYVRRESAKETA